MQPEPVSGLREQGFGILEGLSAPEIIERYPLEWAHWRRYDADYAPPDGESLRSFHARSKLLGSPRGDLGVLLALGLAAGVSLQNGVDAAHEAQLALLAGSAALLYAATILGLAPVRQAATELRVLALAWSVMAAPPLLAALLA